MQARNAMVSVPAELLCGHVSMRARALNQAPLPTESANCSVEVKNEFRRCHERSPFVLEPDIRLNAQGVGQGQDVRNHFAPLPTHPHHSSSTDPLFQLDSPEHFAKVCSIPIGVDRPTAVQELHAFA